MSRKAFALRLSDEVYLAVQRWADDELRSVNAQIEYVLRDALRNVGRLGSPPDPEEDSEPDPGH